MYKSALSTTPTYFKEKKTQPQLWYILLFTSTSYRQIFRERELVAMYAFWSDQEVSISLFIVFLLRLLFVLLLYMPNGSVLDFDLYLGFVHLYWYLILPWKRFALSCYCKYASRIFAHLLHFAIFMFFVKNDWSTNFSKIYSWQSLSHRLLTSLFFFSPLIPFTSKSWKKRFLNKLCP